MPYAHGPGALLSVYYQLSLVLLLTLRLSLSSLPNVLPFKPSSLLSKTYIWSNAHPKLTCVIFLFHLNSELILPLAELLLGVPASLQFHRQVSASSFHRIGCLPTSPHHSWPHPENCKSDSSYARQTDNAGEHGPRAASFFPTLPQILYLIFGPKTFQKPNTSAPYLNAGCYQGCYLALSFWFALISHCSSILNINFASIVTDVDC